jgi:hypothetical protein
MSDLDRLTSLVDPPTLYIMVGLPASGKTTLAKELELQHKALRLTKDDWMMPLLGWGEFEDKREVVEGLLWSMGARALQLGLNVVLDYGREPKHWEHESTSASWTYPTMSYFAGSKRAIGSPA